MEYGTPITPEEIAACDSSPNGVICVLKDLGSKFGECSVVLFVVDAAVVIVALCIILCIA
jgi:hypothetical protein